MSLIDTSVIVLSVFFGFLSGAVGAYAILKTQILNEKVNEFLGDFLERVANDDDFQKKIYLIGGIFAQGAVAGSGLNVKPGKFKFNDIVGQLAGQFLGNLFNRNPNQPQTEIIMPKKEVNAKW